MEANRQKVIKRVKMLKRQFHPSEDFNREMDTSTFDFDLAYKAVRGLRSEEFHKTQAVGERILKWERFKEHPKEKLRMKTNKRTKKVMMELFKENIFTPEKVIENPDLLNRWTMGLSQMSGEMTTKFAVQVGLYVKSLKNMGSEIHHESLLKGAKLEEWGCFWLTELGHGSDVTNIETTAHYDQMTKEFILNSPTETSRKFWIGNLAVTATKAIVFAQLIVNGVRHGLHGFLVEIRNPETFESHNGITIGDCGDKLGLQGIDNGWIMFDKVRVPKESLLNKYADITPDGIYTSAIKSKSKRMAAQLGSLSGGRLAIAQVSVDQGLMATWHAIRYGAVRKQFKSPVTKVESRILDYRLHHHRVIGKFWHHFVQSVAMPQIVGFWDQFMAEGLEKSKLSNFMHLITSCAKAVFSWDACETSRDARQACGGIGFSAYNNFGAPMTIIDLNCTWEGDNNVLIQQAGKLILQNMAYLFQDKPLMPSFEFLKEEIPDAEPFEESLEDLNNILKLFTYRTVNLIQETGSKLQMAENKVAEWDKLLAYNVIPMVFSYFNRFLLSEYISWLNNFEGDLKTRQVFEKIGLVFAQRILISDAATFSDYLWKEQIDSLKDSVMDHLLDLRKEVVALTYLLPFTDKMFGAISRNEMKPYEYFLDAVNYYGSGKKLYYDDDIILSTSG